MLLSINLYIIFSVLPPYWTTCPIHSFSFYQCQIFFKEKTVQFFYKKNINVIKKKEDKSETEEKMNDLFIYLF